MPVGRLRFFGLMLLGGVLCMQGPLPGRYMFRLPAGARINDSVADAAGNVYFAGTTDVALPVTPGAFQTAYQACPPLPVPRGPTRPPCSWGFAGKLLPDGTLGYLTYLGGPNGISYALRVAADSAGFAYVAGIYWTVDDKPADFPLTEKAFQPKAAGPGDTFLVKLNPAGSAVSYATYFGGARNDWPLALAPDAGGNLYVGFRSESLDLPVRRPIAGTAASIEAGYLAKLNADGSDLLFGTYVNAPGARSGLTGLVTDAAGDVYLTGGCFYEQAREEPCVPVTPGALKTRMTGPSAMYVMKVQADGTPVFSTLLGGTGYQGSRGIALDRDGNVVLAGSFVPLSSSRPPDFPITSGAFQASVVKRIRGQPGSGFVLKLNRSGSALLFSTYFGGSSYDGITGFALDGEGNIVFTGYSYSPDLPVTPDAWQPCHPPAVFEYANGLGSDFLGRLSADGRTLLYASFLEPAALSSNPSGLPELRVFAADRSGDVYLGGTDSGPPLLARDRMPVRPKGAAACVADATHGYQSPVAPGSFVRIRGNEVAGNRSLAPAIGPSGTLPVSHQGLQVFLDGMPAPLLRVAPHEITAVVPFDVRVGDRVSVRIVQNGAQNGAVTSDLVVETQPAAPGILTADRSGFGDAAALNEDGSVNSSRNPAAPGSVVSLYLTGLGPFDPAAREGTVAAAPGAVRSGVEVSLYGSPAEVLYAGPAPGLLAGVYQVNIRVPETPLEDWTPLSVTAGSRRAQPQVGLYLRCGSPPCLRWP
jgi:uncharacterized protein (TIGR03437 family)